MAKTVTLTIDGQKVTTPEGMLIVDAAKSVGIHIPVFCYHPKMEPVGMCRMCLVDIGRPVVDRATGQPVLEANGSPKIAFGPKLETACTTPVAEGMVVVGLSDKVKEARKDILEFLLTSHPLDCPVCDKGGECPLQNQTMEFGPGESRFIFDDKMHLQKRVPLGELIFLDRERCIQCARCVRFQDDIAGDPVIGFYQRGRKLEINTCSDPGFDSIFSGNTTDICPVGALTTADFRFGARPWEMNASASICSLCPVGCNTTVNTRREAKSGGGKAIKRIMPRQNEQVNELWICDKGRLAYQFAESGRRLTRPMVRKGGKLAETSWEEALAFAAAGLKKADDVTALVGGRLSVEDLYVLSKLAAAPGKALLYTSMGGGDVVQRYGLPEGSNFKDMGKGAVIIAAGTDLHEEAPLWWLRVKQAVSRGAVLINLHPRRTRQERFAAHNIKPTYASLAAALEAFLPGSKPKSGSPEAQAAEAVKSAESLVIFFGGEGQTLESSQQMAALGAEILSARGLVGKANSGLVGVWSNGNTQGAWELGFRPVDDLAEKLSAARSLLIAGADPAGDDPAFAETLKKSGFLVVQELFMTETARLADVVFPAASILEREGVLVSGERRAQRYYPAVKAPGEARPDYLISSLLAEKLGCSVEYRAAALVFAAAAAEFPAFEGLSYSVLAESPAQWPIVGRRDLYFGGTGYDNHQGLGRALKPAGNEIHYQHAPRKDFNFEADAGSLALVPVSYLYDGGAMLADTHLLDKRKVSDILVLHPDTAGLLKVKDGQAVDVEINGRWRTLTTRVDENAPRGPGLAPAGAGLPANVPLRVNLRVAEKISKPEER